MKNYLSLLAALLLMGATSVMCTSCDDEAGPVDRSGVDENGREYVDLGLPSGTLWAAWNVGADCPEAYGDYFAWGEVTVKTKYYWDTYAWSVGSLYTVLYFTKYCSNSSWGYNGFTDELTELVAADDAATANWGDEWQTPSFAQFEELINPDYTTTEWTTQNGKNGLLVTSKRSIWTGNSIFLPAAGDQYIDPEHSYNPIARSLGSWGYYWARSIMSNSRYAYNLAFCDCNTNADEGSYRCSGQSIRAVRK